MKLCYFFMIATIGVLKCLPVIAVTWATPMEDDSKEPKISFDTNGNIIELIQIPHGFNRVVFASNYSNLKNSWSDLLQLSILGGDAKNVRLVVDPYGNACAVWKINEGNLEKIQASIYKASEDQWSSAKDLSEWGCDICLTHAAMNGSGDVFVAWKELYNEYDIFYTVTFSQSSGKWSRPVSEPFIKLEKGSFSPFLNPMKNAFINQALEKIYSDL